LFSALGAALRKWGTNNRVLFMLHCDTKIFLKLLI
jgi:hypothetical protein